MKLKKQLLKREIAGESFLIPLGDAVYDHNGMFVLNEIGAFIWDILPNVDTEAEILAAILEEYDVKESVAEVDLRRFLENLRQMGII